MFFRTLFVLIFSASTFVLAGVQPLTSKPFYRTTDTINLKQDLDFIRDSLSLSLVRRTLKAGLKPLLKTPEFLQARYDFPPELYEAPETLIYVMIKESPEFRELLTNLANRAQGISKNEAKKEFIAQGKKLIAQLNKDTNLFELIKEKHFVMDPVVLLSPDEKPYKVKTISNVRYKSGKKHFPIADLAKSDRDFINNTLSGETLIENVFEFDLPERAQAYIEAFKRGVKVIVMVDKEYYEKHEDTERLFKLMKAAGVETHLIETNYLNHQKVMVRVSEDPNRCVTRFSTGNATQSGKGASGDLEGELGLSIKYSRPNANVTNIITSRELALYTAHELSKSSEGFVGTSILNDKSFYTGGGFQFWGERGGRMTQYFTPKGGYGDINKLVLAKMIEDSDGPTFSLSFSFSSDYLGDSFIRNLFRQYEKNGTVSMFMLGDNPLMIAPYSQNLRIAGWRQASFQEIKSGTTRKYFRIDYNTLEHGLPEFGYAGLPENIVKFEIEDRIRMAPEVFGRHMVDLPDGTRKEVTARLHLKVIGTEEAVAVASFNFGEQSQNNQEQITVWEDSQVINSFWGIGLSLYERTTSDDRVKIFVEKRNLAIEAEENGKASPPSEGTEISKEELTEKINVVLSKARSPIWIQRQLDKLYREFGPEAYRIANPMISESRSELKCIKALTSLK